MVWKEESCKQLAIINKKQTKTIYEYFFSWEEERAEYLKALALELINIDFRNLVSNDEALCLYVFVEDCYESHVALNDANIGLGDMMRDIEIKYRHLALALDMLPQEQVRKAENECFADLAKNLKIAELATKKVMQVARLTRNLKRALEPPYKKIGKGEPHRITRKFK